MCSIFGLTSARVPRDLIEACFNRTISRGPDMSRLEEIPGGILGFHRLAIMGLNERGMQPFHLGKDAVVCNGERTRSFATASCTASVPCGNVSWSIMI